MRPPSPFCLLLLAGALLSLPATARDLRFPETGEPAFTLLLPDNWKSSLDPNGNLQLANPESTATFSLSLVEAPLRPEQLDVLARAIVTSWESKTPTEISGRPGYRYHAHLARPDGVKVRVEITLVVADATHVLSSSMLCVESIKPADETLARLVHAAIKLAPAPAP